MKHLAFTYIIPGTWEGNPAQIFQPLTKTKATAELATIPSIPSTSPGAESAQAAGRVAAEAAARAAAGGGFPLGWGGPQMG